MNGMNIRVMLNNMVGDEYLLDNGKKRIKTNLTLTVASVILLSLVLFIIYLIRGNIYDASGVGVLAALNLLTLFFLYVVKRQEWALYIFSVGMLLFAFYLLLYGSSQVYSTLWILAYPMLFCLFFGNDFARPYLTLLLASMLLIFSPLFDGWRLNDYSADFQTQLPIMFVAFSLLAMFTEYIRERTSQRLLLMFKHYYESASRDQLTGLLNRRAFYDMIPRELARVRRHQIGLQLVMCDIDHFKVVNDHSGHQGGDLFLQHIARLLITQLRAEDYCFRWGGEEFLLLLPSTSPPQALMVARRLRETIQHTPMYDDRVGEIKATASFGVHAFDVALSVDENVARTDERLYEAKEKGRNRVEQTSTTRQM